jgi:hypothetical protein
MSAVWRYLAPDGWVVWDDTWLAWVRPATEHVVARLEARVALLEGVLRSVEWATAENDEGEYEFCPSCRYFWDEHRDGCRLAAALADGGEGA